MTTPVNNPNPQQPDLEFVYWRHPTLPGIKVEEVSGANDRSPALWPEMARQIYCENGKEAYREIGHFRNGAPFLFGEQGRISITHCRNFLAVATLPPTPEVELAEYSRRAALGIDAEPADRAQVLKIRERFLSDDELQMIPSDEVEQNVLAWTMKEAAYKAAMTEGVDFRRDIRIVRMPKFGPPTPVYDRSEFDIEKSGAGFTDAGYGEVSVAIKGKESSESYKIFSYRSEHVIVTLAYSPKCAKFGKASD